MPKPSQKSQSKSFDPRAYAALQIEFEPKDRAIFLRIAQAFESMAASLEKIAARPPVATSVHLAGESKSEPV